MTYLTAEQIDHATDYGQFSFWKTPIKGSAYTTPYGQVVVHEYEGRCDHETCYETHDTRLVFSLGDRYFLKSGTYDSHDGFQWSGPLKEVRPTEKTVVDYALVPEKVWNAETISATVREYIDSREGTKYSSYDWASLWYEAHEAPVQIPGLPWPVVGTEQYQPGEEDCNGPVWLIFEINGVPYAAKGHNISHVGWDFDSVYTLEIVEKKTVTMEVWQ